MREQTQTMRQAAEQTENSASGWDKRAVIESSIALAAGVMAANAAITGGLAPFGVALSAVEHKNRTPVTVGACIGYMFTFTSLGTLKYVLSMGLLITLQWIFSSGKLFRGLRIPAQLELAVSLGAPSLILARVGRGTIYDFMLAVSEVLLACCAAYFFTRTAAVLGSSLTNARQSDVTAVVISFCIAVIGLLHVNILGVCVGRVLAAFVIFVAVHAAREAGGAIAGVTAGIAVSALGGNNSYFMITYGFGGLLAGVFAPLGRVASILAMFTVHLFTLLSLGYVNSWFTLVEIILAGGLSLLVGARAQERLGLGSAASDAVGSDSYRSMLGGQLSHMSQALRDVAETTRSVNDKLAKLVDGDPASIYHSAAQRVCKSCGQNALCWQKRYNDTCSVMNGALNVLRQNGAVTPGELPEDFALECRNPDELCAMLNKQFLEYTSRETMKRKARQVRGVVTDQFEGMALMIDAMGQELGRLSAQDDAAAARVRDYLKKQTIVAQGLICAVDKQSNMTLEFTMPSYKLSRLDMVELTLRMGELCEREFDLPARYEREGSGVVTLSFWEKAVYVVKWGATQLGNTDSASKLCGDSYSYVDGRGGRVNLILSDGMGSGGAAAVDSTMTAELFRRLLEAGVSMEAGLKLVNSALLVKSGDESLATIDLIGIDLYTGRVDFYKAGAAPTFIRKSGKGGYVQSRSLPVGILNGVSFEKNSLTLREGDWIVMVTDGAVAAGYEWILSDLEHYGGSDPKALSRKLATEAQRRRSDNHQDDITVIAVLLEKGV